MIVQIWELFRESMHNQGKCRLSKVLLWFSKCLYLKFKLLNSAIMELKDSFLEDIWRQIEDDNEQKEEEIVLSKKKRPMNEGIKGSTDEEIEELAKDNLKILLEIIKTKNISSQIESWLSIRDSVPEEEDKLINEPCKLLWHSRMISQKWYANQSDEGRMYWSECQWHETLLKRKKWQNLSEDEAAHIANILANHPDE